MPSFKKTIFCDILRVSSIFSSKCCITECQLPNQMPQNGVEFSHLISALMFRVRNAKTGCSFGSTSNHSSHYEREPGAGQSMGNPATVAALPSPIFPHPPSRQPSSRKSSMKRGNGACEPSYAHCIRYLFEPRFSSCRTGRSRLPLECQQMK